MTWQKSDRYWNRYVILLSFKNMTSWQQTKEKKITQNIYSYKKGESKKKGQ